MLKITVLDAPIRNMKGIGKASGKPYDIDFQTVWIHTVSRDGTPSPFPEKTEVMLERDPQSLQSIRHAPGEYSLHPSSVYIGDRGNAEVALRLVPLNRKPVA